MKLEIYENPALGIGDDDARMEIICARLQDLGIEIRRYDPFADPDAFETNEEVRETLTEEGSDALPMIYLDEVLMYDGGYPSTEEVSRWFEWTGSACPMSGSGACGGCAGCGDIINYQNVPTAYADIHSNLVTLAGQVQSVMDQYKTGIDNKDFNTLAAANQSMASLSTSIDTYVQQLKGQLDTTNQ